MGKSMNPKLSGFRKWAKSPEPTKIDKARTGANEGGVIAAADVDQDRRTPEATTARPWLVPGASRGRCLDRCWLSAAAPRLRQNLRLISSVLPAGQCPDTVGGHTSGS